MNKLSYALNMIVIMLALVQCSTTEKYQAKLVEDCVVLTKWVPQAGMDWASCFCVDKNIKDENAFITILEARVKLNMSNHPLAQQAMDYIQVNKAAIIKNKQYELPVQYCRGYSATNPNDRTYLQKWAEDNRLGRIKCEDSIPTSP